MIVTKPLSVKSKCLAASHSNRPSDPTPVAILRKPPRSNALRSSAESP